MAHGDIRVDNVLVDPTKDWGVLFDFVLASFAGDEYIKRARKLDVSGMGWLFGEGLCDP